jgi:hypothetical protein
VCYESSKRDILGSSSTMLGVSFTISIVPFFKVDGTLGSNYSKLDLRHSDKPSLTHAPPPRVPTTFDFGNPATDSDSYAPTRGFFVLWPESSGSFPLVVFCGFCAFSLFSLNFMFSLYFVVLAFWVGDVNTFLAYELKGMLLPMYQIKSVWSKPVVTTEN